MVVVNRCKMLRPTTTAILRDVSEKEDASARTESERNAQ